MEKTELNEQSEDEMMSSEASALLADLNSEIAHGESLGVFTSTEAAQWYSGADACTKISHLAGLLSYIGRFIASGEARLAKLESAINNDLLTSGEQISLLSSANNASYEGKAALISEVKSLVRRLEGLKSELVGVLNKKNLATSDKSALISKFYSASSESKSGVISEATSVNPVIEEKPVEQVAARPSVATERPVVESEQPVQVATNPKTECLIMVDRYLEHAQFTQAADLAEASARNFNLVEYRALLKKIEKGRIAKELPELQVFLRAA